MMETSILCVDDERSVYVNWFLDDFIIPALARRGHFAAGLSADEPRSFV